MTFAFFGNGLYTCLSTDTKTTAGITANSVVVEINTGKIFQFTGGVWVPTLLNSSTIRLINEAVEPTATTTSLPLYRTDIDVNNQAVYISKLENGSPIKIRIA